MWRSRNKQVKVSCTVAAYHLMWAKVFTILDIHSSRLWEESEVDSTAFCSIYWVQVAVLWPFFTAPLAAVPQAKQAKGDRLSVFLDCHEQSQSSSSQWQRMGLWPASNVKVPPCLAGYHRLLGVSNFTSILSVPVIFILSLPNSKGRGLTSLSSGHFYHFTLQLLPLPCDTRTCTGDDNVNLSDNLIEFHKAESIHTERGQRKMYRIWGLAETYQTQTPQCESQLLTLTLWGQRLGMPDAAHWWICSSIKNSAG